MVHFVGAGSGAADLITVRGAKLLGEADVVIYAGSLVNPAVMDYTKAGCEIHDSAKLTLEEVIALIEKAEAAGRTTVRLHTGDSSIYGAVRERRAGKTRYRLRRLPRRQRLLRRGGGSAGGVHPARCEPDRHHHPRSRPHAGAGAGVHPLTGRPSGHHGAVSQHLTDRTAAR